MILTAHQPVYLPWLGLFHKIALADTFVSFNKVQYLTKDWNNRNKIKTANGVIWLSVPVHSKGHREKSINEIEINNNSPWGRKHWHSIKFAYSKSPFFTRYADFFENLYMREWHFLEDLNDHILKYLLSELKIKTRFVKASEMDFQGTGSDLVLDMCVKMGANFYIFGALGKDYAEVDKYKKANIKLHFQDYKHPQYPQLWGDFEPYLSIIDLLFIAGPNSFDKIMENNVSQQELLNVI